VNLERPGVEAAVRLASFAAVFAAMALWELHAPRRPLALPRPRRWAANLGLVLINTLLVRVALPVSMVGAAALAEQGRWGLFNQWAWPSWLRFLVAIVALDLAIYFQHVLFHAVPALWRLHLVHHADLDFDATTGVRFHPFEILLSAVFKLAAVAALGPSPLAVLVFEVALNASSIFNHANVHIPFGVDRLLRLVLVTPDMHRVHHSARPDETNSNFGFQLSWWDRLFGTYRGQPALGHVDMTIGLAELRDERRVDRLGPALALPFTAGAGNVPIDGQGPASG
jgi:sterol desaturase/sphingolipid hydroxylase (fatty acid hydroxylase superfamily)